jgi:hypothetical protein
MASPPHKIRGRGINEVTTRFQKRVKQLSTGLLVCYTGAILVTEGHGA